MLSTRRTRRPAAVLGLAALALTVAACGSSGDGASTADSASAKPLARLEITAPAAPGGGWDSTSRAAQAVLQGEGIVKSVQVVNVPGAGGTIGLAKLANSKGKGQTLMTMGLVMVGAIETNKSAATLDDVTPIARLTSEQEAIVVPASSPYKTLAEFVAAWKTDPGKLAIAGGSAGGTDQILAGLLAQSAGIDPKKVNYIAYSGGGEALAAILGSKVAAGISGVSEFTDQVAAGKMRALAVSGSSRVEGFDAPTIKESGLDVELTNWRGIVAPAGISESDKAALVAAVEKMHESAGWQAQLKKNGWDDAFLPAAAFATFLAEEKTRVSGVLKSLGLT
ncbi:MAG TPA: tripartite tricarboxylate transporter substrate binding protein [Mycobacteriales bacterium]|nr:tripartite tricarboxylate transporter substrate binding protein [Mycobacteriales bacterium]